MAEQLAIGLAVLTMLGAVAQWVAWRLKAPAILFLLATGIIAGPTGLVDPKQLFSEELLLAIVSLSVALILFEGGLSLRLRELGDSGRVVLQLISVGAVVTWLTSTAASYYLLNLPLELAFLLGAVLVVTGPTVVGPLLQHIRQTGPTGPILKWEGIAIDPVGASLALLVFEAITANGDSIFSIAVQGVLATIATGTVIGLAAAGLLFQLLKRYLAPDWLQIPITLATVLGAFVISNRLQHESGFLTVTIMGAVLANQRSVSVRHILEFKENLRVLLISSLFILLASRVDMNDLLEIGWKGIVFVLALVFVVRPLSVLFATLRSNLAWRDRVFIMSMAPRGVVAVSVASVFALELQLIGRPGHNILVPATFFAIIGTVIIYGLGAGWVARRLGLAGPIPQGLLIVGAQPWSRKVASAINKAGFRVVLVDTNRSNVSEARLQGLEAFWGDVLSEQFASELDLRGIGRLIALTRNDQVNRLAAHHFVETFGRSMVYRLPLEASGKEDEVEQAQDNWGRHLFGTDVTYQELSQRASRGADIKATAITEEYDFEAYSRDNPDAHPLFLIRKERELVILTSGTPAQPMAGDVVLSFMSTSAEHQANRDS